MFAFICNGIGRRHKDLMAFLAKVSLFAIFLAEFDDMDAIAFRAMVNLDFTFRVRYLDVQSGKNEILDLTELLIIHSDKHFNQFIQKHHITQSPLFL